jgi:dihydroorotate dehydrogenase (NAD+) catalytic subunit
MGGIMNGRDSIEFILAGATAVAVGTAHFINPVVSVQVLEEMEHFMREQGVTHINNLIGGLITK